MNSPKIAIVGAGVMGEALLKALISSLVDSTNIYIWEKRQDRAREICKRYGVTEGEISEANIVFLAIKPQDLQLAAGELQVQINSSALIVSLLAGVKIDTLSLVFGKDARIVRLMPNTPLSVGMGMSAICPGSNSTSKDINWLSSKLRNSGETLVIDERFMDAVTAVSGSGPAYIFKFVEGMIKSAIEMGLTAKESDLLVRQTLLGAAKMLSDSAKDPGDLSKEVTSPNGTTAAALAVFEAERLQEIICAAMKAARDRSQELSN